MSITINNQTFSSLDEAQKYIEAEQIDVQNEDIQALFDTDVTLVQCQIISPENHQRAITTYIDQNDVKYEKAKIELTLTSQYHSWHNTTADAIKNELYSYDENNSVIIPDDLLIEYNNYVANYKILVLLN